MRASRAPEGRGINKQIVLIFAIIVAIIGGVIIAYLSMGSDSISAKNDLATVSPDSLLTTPPGGDQALAVGPTPTAEPTAAPVSAPTSTPDPNLSEDSSSGSSSNDGSSGNPQSIPAATAQPASATGPTVLPDAQFGEVLEEGFTQLKFPGGSQVETWYSFQVDTKTRDITLFFAQYDDRLESIVATVKVEQYTRGNDIANAEVTLYFPEGSRRVLLFDAEEGSIALDQQYTLPVRTSMFSSGMRRALVYYGMNLYDEAGEIEVQLHLDLSGLSQSEGLEFKRLVPQTVDAALLELQFLVEQIEGVRLER